MSTDLWTDLRDSAQALINLQLIKTEETPMKKYRIQIDLSPVGYELEAEGEDKAQEYAQECFYDETMYDLLKYAKYTIVEVSE